MTQPFVFPKQNTPIDIMLVNKALEFATKAHQGQTRRFTGAPYITHCVGVKQILQDAGVNDEITLSAALLHDTIEDCQVTRVELQQQFGEQIVKLVTELTDNLNLNRDQRHHQQALKINSMDKRSIFIKMADRIYNLQDFTKATIHYKQLGRKDEIERADSYTRYARNLQKAIIMRMLDCNSNNVYSNLFAKLNSCIVELETAVRS